MNTVNMHLFSNLLRYYLNYLSLGCYPHRQYHNSRPYLFIVHCYFDWFVASFLIIFSFFVVAPSTLNFLLLAVLHNHHKINYQMLPSSLLQLREKSPYCARYGNVLKKAAQSKCWIFFRSLRHFLSNSWSLAMTQTCCKNHK